MSRRERMLLDLELTRLPLLVVRPRPVINMGWADLGHVHGKPIAVSTPAGVPRVRDALLLAALTTAWDRQGQDPSRVVSFTVRQAARWMGYGKPGGRQAAHMMAALDRLAGTSIRSARRGRDGLVLTEWGLIEHSIAGEGKQRVVRISAVLAAAVMAGASTYLDRGTFEALLRSDPMATRLWLLLEGERLSRPWSYPVFAAPRGHPAAPRDIPAIADLLRLGWSDRGEVIKRLRRAIRILAALDPRYTLAIVRSPGDGMWRLDARRTASSEGVRGTRITGRARVPDARPLVSPETPGPRTSNPPRPHGPVASPVVSTVGEHGSTSERLEQLADILERHTPGFKARWMTRRWEESGR